MDFSFSRTNTTSTLVGTEYITENIKHFSNAEHELRRIVRDNYIDYWGKYFSRVFTSLCVFLKISIAKIGTENWKKKNILYFRSEILSCVFRFCFISTIALNRLYARSLNDSILRARSRDSIFFDTIKRYSRLKI